MHIPAALKPDEQHNARQGGKIKEKMEMKDYCFPVLSMYDAKLLI